MAFTTGEQPAAWCGVDARQFTLNETNLAHLAKTSRNAEAACRQRPARSKLIRIAPLKLLDDFEAYRLRAFGGTNAG